MSGEFEALLAELESVEGCPRTKSRVRAVLSRYAGQRMRLSHAAIIAFERRALLARFASESYPRAELVRMLSERWGISRRQARRWISANA